MPDLTHLFEGRVARLNYFIAALALGVLAWLLSLVLHALGAVGLGASWLVAIVYAVLLFSLVIRRIHDIGWSGWWCLLLIIPIVNIVFGLLVLFLPGTQGGNAYGAEPSKSVDIWRTLIPRGTSATSL